MREKRSGVLLPFGLIRCRWRILALIVLTRPEFLNHIGSRVCSYQNASRTEAAGESRWLPCGRNERAAHCAGHAPRGYGLFPRGRLSCDHGADQSMPHSPPEAFFIGRVIPQVFVT